MSTPSRVTVVPSRRVRFEANPFESLIALLTVVAAVTYFLGPERYLEQSAIGITLPLWWAHLWNLGYGLGGLGIIVGLWLGSARVEAAALVLLATAFLIQTVATWDAAGGNAFVALLFLVAMVGACGVRLHTILSGRRHIIVDTRVDLDA